MELVNSDGLDHCVNSSTHHLGGLLGVVTTRSDQPPSTVKIMDVDLSYQPLL